MAPLGFDRNVITEIVHAERAHARILVAAVDQLRARGARRGVRFGSVGEGGEWDSHLLRAAKPSPDGARIAWRAAAALQPDALILALA